MIKEPISIVFFGTHEFACTILTGLIENPTFSVTGVITQTDKPVGRKKVLTPPPVKILAEKHGLVVHQPTSLKTFDVKQIPADIYIVAQYGKIIPTSILNAPTHGILNVHTSLLPTYRGATPIQSAILHGEKETGGTIMKMDAGLDTGDILTQKTILIDPDETYLDVDKKLAILGSALLGETIPAYITGAISPEKQDDSKATHCKQLSREDGKVDWGKDAEDIYNQYRAFTPWPGLWTTWNEKRLKLLSLRPYTEYTLGCGIVSIEDNRIIVGTNTHTLEIFSLQLEGKKPMTAYEFIHGFSYIDGQLLGGNICKQQT
ncbi:MAG: methionyl-tRNA formyltransferase [Candidatus Magasanikbacteria bacterium]|nr:methionyl-tRNA formyltransferase [Candidatus Magasanikbacteria bacterium]